VAARLSSTVTRMRCVGRLAGGDDFVGRLSGAGGTHRGGITSTVEANPRRVVRRTACRGFTTGVNDDASANGTTTVEVKSGLRSEQVHDEMRAARTSSADVAATESVRGRTDISPVRTSSPPERKPRRLRRGGHRRRGRGQEKHGAHWCDVFCDAGGVHRRRDTAHPHCWSCCRPRSTDARRAACAHRSCTARRRARLARARTTSTR